MALPHVGVPAAPNVGVPVTVNVATPAGITWAGTGACNGAIAASTAAYVYYETSDAATNGVDSEQRISSRGRSALGGALVQGWRGVQQRPGGNQTSVFLGSFTTTSAPAHIVTFTRVE